MKEFLEIAFHWYLQVRSTDPTAGEKANEVESDKEDFYPRNAERQYDNVSETKEGTVEKPTLSNRIKQTNLQPKPQKDKSATQKSKLATRKKKVSFSEPPSEELSPVEQDSNQNNRIDKERTPSKSAKGKAKPDEPPADWFVIETIIDHGETEGGEL